MNEKAFRYIGGQAWVEMERPFDCGCYNCSVRANAYNNRLHYDVQPKPKEWEEGRLIIDGVDFNVIERCYVDYPTMGENDCVSTLSDEYCRCQFAEPIQPTMKEERKFTLEEMLHCWDESTAHCLACVMGGPEETPDRYKYFKEKFNIDL